MAKMPTLDAPMLRGWWLLVAVSCSSTATRPGTTGMVATGPQPVAVTGGKAAPVAATPAVTCEVAMQNVTMLWATASSQLSHNLQAIYLNAGNKLAPALRMLCQNDQWSPAGRTCVAQAVSLPALDICTRDFSAGQQTHIQVTTAEIIATVDLTPTPAPQPGLPQP